MRLFFVIWVFTFSHFGFGAEFRESDTGLIFPDSLNEWHKGRETRFPEAALGSSVAYQKKGAAVITVYVYLGGHESIPSGGESEAISMEMAGVAQGVIESWTRQGAQVKSVIPPSEYRYGTPETCLGLLTVHSILMNGQTLISISGLTGYKNRIFKIRYTSGDGNLEGGLKTVAEFLQLILKANMLEIDPFFKPALKPELPTERID